MQRPRPAVLAAFVLAGIVLRLLPFVLYRFFDLSIDPKTTIYPWNFSPIPAICLFGAATMFRERNAFFLMLGAWLFGDICIGLLSGNISFAFYRAQVGVYLGYGLVLAIGTLLRERRSFLAVAGAGVASAVTFFVVSNFAVWSFGDGTLYPHTLQGLMNCYTMAIPYFRNSVISLAIFMPVLFSPIALRSPAPQSSHELAVQAA